MDYTKPAIADYGDLKALTAGASEGSTLDASFPTGTHFSDLTFS